MTPTPTELVRCELWLRAPAQRPDPPPGPAYTFQRIWILADVAGAGYLETYHPPQLHDHLEIPGDVGHLLNGDHESAGHPPGSLLVVGRSWMHFARGRLLQVVLAPVGRLVRHDGAGTDHLCVTAH